MSPCFFSRLSPVKTLSLICFVLVLCCSQCEEFWSERFEFHFIALFIHYASVYVCRPLLCLWKVVQRMHYYLSSEISASCSLLANSVLFISAQQSHLFLASKKRSLKKKKKEMVLNISTTQLVTGGVKAYVITSSPPPPTKKTISFINTITWHFQSHPLQKVLFWGVKNITATWMTEEKMWLTLTRASNYHLQEDISTLWRHPRHKGELWKR